MTQFYSTGNGGMGFGAQAGGGQPGACRSVTHDMATNPAWIALFHERLGATFDPATQGMISLIDFSMDIATFADASHYGGQHAGLALRQNSAIYVGPFVVNGLTSWLTVEQNGLAADSFTEYQGTGHPDFSTGAAPIQFGFVTGNHNPPGGAPASQTIVGYDNWSVSLMLDVSGVPGASRPVTELRANVPNPFRSTTRIDFELARPGPASIRIFDVSGKLARSFHLPNQPQGPASLTWDGRDASGRSMPDGVYFYRLETGDDVRTRRMTLLRGQAMLR